MNANANKQLRFLGAIYVLGLTLMIGSGSAAGASLTWDAGTNTGSGDGSGTWSTSTAAWWNGGPSDSFWTTSGTDTAIFGNVGSGTYNVNVSGSVGVGGITFNAGNALYNISGAAIALNTASPTITMNASSGTIGSQLTGSNGLIYGGTGLLNLTGANSYTGGTTISAGTLQVNPTTTYSTASSGYYVAPGATFNFVDSGTFDVHLASALSGSGTVNLNNTGYSMYLGANNSSFSGTINTSGTSTLFLSQSNATSSNAAYVLNMASGNGYGSFSTLGVTGNMTINFGSLSGTNASTKITDSYNETGSTVTYSIGALGTNTTFAGYFANYKETVALTKVGTGELTLTGASTYTGLTTISEGTLQISNPSAGYTTTTSGYNVAGGVLDLTDAVTNDLHVNSPISGSGTVNLLNTGYSLHLNANNSSFAGTINVNGNSTVFLDQTNAASANDAYVVNINGNGNGGGSFSSYALTGSNTISLGSLSGTTSTTLIGSYTGNGTVTWSIGALGTSTTFAGIFVNNSATNALTKVGTGDLTLTGANTYTGATFISSGTLQIGAGGTTGSLSANSAITDNGTLAFNLGSNAVQGAAFGSGISGSGSLVQMGSGSLTLNTANSYTGGTIVSGGTLQMGNVLATGTGALAVNGGVFDMNGLSPTVSSLSGAGGTILNNASGVAATLTVNMPSGATTYSGAIANGLGAFSLTTSGAGSLTLAGSNTFTGATNVTGGTLLLASGGTLASPNINVAPGALFDVSALSGGFTLGGGTLTAGRTGAATTNINGSLTLNNSLISVAGGTNSGTMTVNGNLNLTGDTLAIGQAGAVALAGSGALALGGIDYIVPNTALSSGTYNLFTFSSLASGGTADLALAGNFVSNPRQLLSFGISGGTAVTLNVMGQAGNLYWTGAGSGVWYTGTNATANWFNSNNSAADYFYSGDNVTFSDSGTSPQTVTISGTAQPATLTVSNTAVAYTFSGTGSIIGGTTLMKGGPGSLTISNSNAYTGGTSLAAGVINANAAYAMGSGPVTVSGGTLNDGATNSLGSGALTVSGGTVNLNNAQTIASATLSAGLLNLGNSAALGSGLVSLGGGTFNNTSGGTLTLAGNNAQNWNGNFTFFGSNSLNMGSGSVALSGNSQVTVNANVLTIPGAISGGYSLTVNGPGTLSLIGSNSYTGGTTLNSGFVSFASGGLGSAGNITLGGGTLQWNGTNTQDISSRLTMLNSTTVTLDTQGNNVTLASAIGSNSSASLVKAGSGMLTLTAANTYTGLTTISAGTLQVSNPSSGYTTTTSGYNVAGGVLDLTDAVTNDLHVNSPISGSGTVNLLNTGYSLHLNANNSSFAGTVNVNGNSTVFIDQINAASANDAYVVNINGNGNGGGSFSSYALTGSNTISLGSLSGTTSTTRIGSYLGNGTVTWSIGALGTSTTFAGIFVNNAVTNALAKVGTGDLTLSGASTFSGGTTISAGTLQYGAANALLSSGAVNVSGPSAILDLGGYGATVGPFTLTNGTLQDGTLAASSFALQNGLVSAALTGGGQVTKSGTGTVLLSSANYYTGGTYIGGGTLQLGSGNSLGSAGAVTVNSGVLDLNGTYYPSVPGLSGSAGVITNSSTNAVTLSVNQSIATTFSGSLQDGASSVAVNLNGGTLTLFGNNTHSGPTTISVGASLVAGTANTLSPNSAVTNYGLLDVTAGSQTIAGLSMYGGQLNLLAGNLLTSTGYSSLGGTLNVFGTANSGLIDLINFPNSYNGTFAPGVIPMGYTLSYSNTGQVDLVLATVASSAWSSSMGGSWTGSSNWTSGVPSGQAVTALLGGALAASGTVTLDGSQTVGTLIFNNSAASYTLTPGNGGSLTLDNTGGTGSSQIIVLAGTHSISAPLTIANGPALVSLINSGSLDISGDISEAGGSHSLSLSSSDGTGLLSLDGSNSFTGGVYVNSGTLLLNGANALAPGSALVIGTTVPASVPSVISSPAAAPAPSLAPVPEPGTLTLFGVVVLWSAVACYRFSKRPV